MPEPRISIQPVCLQVAQPSPVPPQIWHCTSISADGSVNGKNDGRNRTRVSARSEEHTSELQSHSDLVCRLLLEKKNKGARLRPCTAPRRTRSSRVGDWWRGS